MVLPLCLLLSVLSPSSQDSCSAPGALPAPILYLSLTSPQPGDYVQLRCSVFSWHPATRVVFCKDGEEVSSQGVAVGKSTHDYKHAVTEGSAGNYACLYEIKESENQVKRSQLSPAQHLSVTVKGSDTNLVVGIMIPIILVLAVGLCLLVKKGYVSVSPTTLSRCLPVGFLSRNRRQQVQHDTRNTPEDHIEYASVTFSSSSQPRTEEVTYAAITAKHNRHH